ncbi:MAG: GNAT family N-acetyltransferase [Anaeroplasmataceae bacterium]
MITYKNDYSFKQEDVVALFKSHNWESAMFPTRLYKALINSPTVITAYDGDKLVGLARAIDDTEMVAYVHYVIVMKGYEGHGIASNMMRMIMDKYKNYLYIKVIPANSSVGSFYEKLGFKIKADGIAMQIVNDTDKR